MDRQDSSHGLTRRQILAGGLWAAGGLTVAAALFPGRTWAGYTFSRSGRKYPAVLKLSSQVASITPGYIWEYTKLVQRQLGIEAEWRTYLAGAPQIQAFGMDQWDIGYIGVPPLITGIDKGMKAVAIAVGHSEGANVVARKGAGFKTLEELGGDLGKAWRQFRGKTIGLPPQGSIQDAVTRTGLAEAGVTDRDVELRNYKSVPSLPDLLAQGQIDAFVGWPPFDVVAIDEKQAGMVVIPGDQLGGKGWAGYPMNCLVASERIIREYPDVVEDCVFLHTKVNQFIMAYPEEGAKMAAAILKVSEPLTLKGYYLTPNFCPVITDATMNSSLRFVTTLLDAKYITNRLTREQIFNTSFIRRVHPEPCTTRTGKVLKDPQLFEFITGKKA